MAARCVITVKWVTNAEELKGPSMSAAPTDRDHAAEPDPVAQYSPAVGAIIPFYADLHEKLLPLDRSAPPPCREGFPGCQI
jgi:hypothetical protein